MKKLKEAVLKLLCKVNCHWGCIEEEVWMKDSRKYKCTRTGKVWFGHER